MKLASFDVGIKNMAYCIFDCSSNTPVIIDWNVVNLMNHEPVSKILCNQHTKTNKVCNKKAKYEFSKMFFCEKHAKSSSHIVPDSSTSLSSLKKMKKQQLIDLANNRFIPVDLTENREVLLVNINNYLVARSLKPIKSSKTKASTIDLITIGKNIKSNFDNITQMNDVDKIVIENQISPIATRMKTIQGMLAQYFIMKNENIDIEFLSSSGKLKGFEKMNENIESNYKQHKKDAIFYCKKFLEKPEYNSWNWILDNEKKDDLADCFLQGIWFFNEKIKK